jgi:hypothetical protein
MKITIPAKELPHYLRVVTQKVMTEEIDIPESWGNVHEFAEWWSNNNMPILVPEKYEVYVSDDATSICLFRKGRYQVELYLIYPGPNLPVHEHPGVDVIKMRLNTYKEENNTLTPVTNEVSSNTLLRGQSHGAGINFKDRAEQNITVSSQGFPLLAFQKWDEGLEMTTVASRWKGSSVGPKQEDIVKRFNPKAYTKSGYIDVTRSS